MAWTLVLIKNRKWRKQASNRLYGNLSIRQVAARDTLRGQLTPRYIMKKFVITLIVTAHLPHRFPQPMPLPAAHLARNATASSAANNPVLRERKPASVGFLLSGFVHMQAYVRMLVAFL